MLTELVSDGDIITGGDLAVTDLISPPAFCLATFQLAVHTYAMAKREGLGLGVLVNDIGTTCAVACDGHSLAFDRATFMLPESYRVILDSYGVAEGDVKIFWEKHLRNRGKNVYVKQFGSLDVNEEGLALKHTRVQIPLFRYSPSTDHMVAACPLIMATFHAEQERRGFLGSVNIYPPVGASPIDPIVSKGTFVAETLGWISGLHRNFYLKEGCLYEDSFLEQLRNVA